MDLLFIYIILFKYLLNTNNKELSKKNFVTSIACAEAISTKRITINLKFLIDIAISLMGTVPTLLVFIDHSSPIFFAFRVFHKYGI